MEINEVTNLIKEIIEKTNISVNEISVSEPDVSSTEPVWVKIEVDQPHFFLARDGEALFALNHVVRRIIESKTPDKKAEENSSLIIDINGFQKKRIENLHAIAHMMAERARYFKSRVEVDPMSAYERRIVHEFLSKETDLKTESEGVGSSRRVVIKYIGSI